MVFYFPECLIDNWGFRLKTPAKYWKPAAGFWQLSLIYWKPSTGDLAREKYEDEVECLLSLWAGFYYQHLPPQERLYTKD